MRFSLELSIRRLTAHVTLLLGLFVWATGCFAEPTATGRCGRDVAYLVMQRFEKNIDLISVTEALGANETVGLDKLQAFLSDNGLDVQAKFLPTHATPQLEHWLAESPKQTAVILVVPTDLTRGRHHALLLVHCGPEGFEAREPGTDRLVRYDWTSFGDVEGFPMLWITGEKYAVRLGGPTAPLAMLVLPKSSIVLSIIASFAVLVWVFPDLAKGWLGQTRRLLESFAQRTTTINRSVLLGLCVVPAAIAAGWYMGRGGQKVQIDLSSHRIKLGTMKFGEDRNAAVTLRNRSDRKVSVVDIRSTCSCVTASDNASILMPGETVTMNFGVHATGFGLTQQTVEILTNPPSVDPLVVDFQYISRTVPTIAPRQTTVGSIFIPAKDGPEGRSDDRSKFNLTGTMAFTVRDFDDDPCEALVSEVSDGPLRLSIEPDSGWSTDGKILVRYLCDPRTEFRGPFSQDFLITTPDADRAEDLRQRVRVFGKVFNEQRR